MTSNIFKNQLKKSQSETILIYQSRSHFKFAIILTHLNFAERKHISWRKCFKVK